MKKMDRKMDDQALEGLFDAARANPAEVPDDLMARIMQDAQDLQPKPIGTGWRGWLNAIGGLPAMGGLVTATCVGFWIGVAAPDGLSNFTGQVIAFEEYTELDAASDVVGFGWDIEEGNTDG
jgi:hypothetical protein